MQSTIRLFKALPINDREMLPVEDEQLNKETLAKGFIFDGQVQANYQDKTHLIELVNQAYGRSSEELNQSFHKSFAKVRDASRQQLVFEQMVHYLTTYGVERMGIYNEGSVYIPAETLDAPEIEDGIRVVVIRGLTKDELKAEMLKLLATGAALHERTIADVLDVATFVGVDEDDLKLVKNKEVLSALYDYLGIVPSTPVEFLRYVVFRSTNQTLLIKNKKLIDQIKEQKNFNVAASFDAYEKEHGLNKLASIFYRYKPIFLAFRTNTKMKKTINRVRRLAVANHKPMTEDLLNTITARLERGENPGTVAMQQALRETNVFRKIRLAYALKFRTTDADSILYRVRNGRSFATDFSFENKKGAGIVYNIVMREVIESIRPNVEGKKFFIPEGLKYGLPATEKQFTGNLPTGTYVEVPEDMVVGVHWENTKNYRVDLDLKISNDLGSIGWDASYRDNEQDIQFSGDVTDAPLPKGASEVFHVGGRARGSWLLNLNYYNFNANEEVPFKIIVAKETRELMSKDYVVDPNKLVALSSSVMNVRQKALGIIVADEKSAKFYFAESDFQNNISSRHNKGAEQARKFLLNYYTDSIILNDVLVDAGAEIVTEMAEDVVDLSPEAVDKATILNLLEGNNG